MAVFGKFNALPSLNSPVALWLAAVSTECFVVELNNIMWWNVNGEEKFVAYYTVLSRHSPGETEENKGKQRFTYFVFHLQYVGGDKGLQ